MTRSIFTIIYLLFLFFIPSSILAQTKNKLEIDVMHYDVKIEPNFDTKTVVGNVLIRFRITEENLKTIKFNSGVLSVDSIYPSKEFPSYSQQDNQLIISLSPDTDANSVFELQVYYHGTPRFGLSFFQKQSLIYTEFSTSEWMVCVDDPSDKASINLELVLPKHLKAVGNGRLAEKKLLQGDKISYQWHNDQPIPSYTFGFAAGDFVEHSEKYRSSENKEVELQYLSGIYSKEELAVIFRNTPNMISFFEKRSGIPYSGSIYTQVLAEGSVAQEMSEFTVIRESYGKELLANEKNLGLIAHELAHQWWGNQVTCVNWNHFWLNEGMATFMAIAYKEHQFGRKEYLTDIEKVKLRYQKVKEAGKDKSLLFSDWDNPSGDDRTLVYQKGAYVLHLLREELGEKKFWKGIQDYTRTCWGKSVETNYFQLAMEKAGGKDLDAFFASWVYLKK